MTANTTLLETLSHNDKLRCVAMLDGSARSDIEIFCRGGQGLTEGSGLVMWIDIGQIPECPVEKEMVENAIWWCEKRGLFTRHHQQHHLIRFHSVAREQYETAPDDTLDVPAFLRRQAD